MPIAVIIGASSGLGAALALELSQRGFTLGLTARRLDWLSALASSLPGPSTVMAMDVTQPVAAQTLLKDLIRRLGGMDCLILNAGTAYRRPTWNQEANIIQVNIQGFAALARTGFHFFRRQGFGLLAGVSSIAGLRGRADHLVYSASKAFVSTYLEGLRQKTLRLGLPIVITDILPGYIDTPLIQDGRPRFWVVSAQTAAKQIAAALARRATRVYVPRRWRLMAWALRLAPRWLYTRV